MDRALELLNVGNAGSVSAAMSNEDCAQWQVSLCWTWVEFIATLMLLSLSVGVAACTHCIHFCVYLLS